MNELLDVREVLLALGANLPGPDGQPPGATLRAAVAMLEERLGAPLTVSRHFRTPCFPPGAGPDYINAAARLETDLCAAGILAVLHEVEAAFGRERLGRWGQRTLDIDLIACGQEIAPDSDTLRRWIDLPTERQIGQAPPGLILPHPRVQDRGFVLVPMAEIAPDWCHPLLGRTVRGMLGALPAAALADIAPVP